MKYTEEFLRKIMQCGTLGYPMSKILNILDFDNEDQFKEDFYDNSSEIQKNYQKGVDRADFLLDIKLFEMAKSGDLKAIEMYEKRKNQQVKIKQNEDSYAKLNKIKE